MLDPAAADLNARVFVPIQAGLARVFGPQTAVGLLLRVSDPARTPIVTANLDALLRSRCCWPISRRTRRTAAAAGERFDPTLHEQAR